MAFWKGIIVLAFVLPSFLFVNRSYATPACGGNIYCYPTYNLCRNTVTGEVDCIAGTRDCSCSAVCDGGAGGPVSYSCSSFSSSQCTDPSWGATFCNNQCAGFGGQGALASNGCFLTPDACQVASDCNTSGCQTCCGGSPNTCSSLNVDCAGNPIAGCGVAPTPTPTPDACAAFGGQAGCNAWCQSQGHTGCNEGCVGCFDGPTPIPPTPTTAPTPTTGPSQLPVGSELSAIGQ